MQVLLLEDNATVRQALYLSLTRAGHRVFAVETVAQAHDVATNRSLDLIISDFFLPDGTGADFMGWIRQRQAVPGIAISGDTDPGVRELCLRAGFLMFLPKPVMTATLDRAMSQVLAMEERASWCPAAPPSST